IVQILVGGLTVLLKLPPLIVAVHLSNAMLIFAALIVAATFAFRPIHFAAASSPTEIHLRRYARASLIGTFILLVSGTFVTGSAAGYTCPTFPLCNDEIIPTNLLQQIAMAHRYIAGAIGLLILFTLNFARRAQPSHRELQRVGMLALILFAAQTFVGAWNVIAHFPLALNLLHLAFAAALWGALVVFTVLAHYSATQVTRSNNQTATPTQSKLRAQITNYLLLTKPWIVALLLVTTLGAMLVAARGVPDIALLFFTLVGGMCAAAGANTLNSYYDREIDKTMARTSQRPIPTGRVAPRRALIFGIALCSASVFILATLVNGLSALLALAGIIYYAGIYTVWLKRATPQNVVIGGAAGAIPPLVGWAAVTNDLNLFAIYLFLIIFYWTPPHTWALMVMLKKDYARVGIPMLPVARGEAETHRQILLYSLLMVAITLIPFSLQELGAVYFVTAFVLGAGFLYLAAKLVREASKQTARRLYVYSNLYLALLFLAMVIDRAALA
ncbi:MAG: protoheme IX farnesyltransferase, partial [Chloroflexi bacterium]|nr:protoheme IX farnesyltransferase [Chloroflexota bacterium]